MAVSRQMHLLIHSKDIDDQRILESYWPRHSSAQETSNQKWQSHILLPLQEYLHVKDLRYVLIPPEMLLIQESCSLIG